MRRLFADRLVFATGVIVILMSILFALLRVETDFNIPFLGRGALAGPPDVIGDCTTRMKNIWKVIDRLMDHDCEISSTSDQILRAGGIWVGFHTGWVGYGPSTAPGCR